MRSIRRVHIVCQFINRLTEAVFKFTLYFYVVLAGVCMIYSVAQSVFTIWLIINAISSIKRFSSRYGTENTEATSGSRLSAKAPTSTRVKGTLFDGLQQDGNSAKKIVATILLCAVILLVALVCTIYSYQGTSQQHSYVSQVSLTVGATYILVACELFRQIQEICRSALSA